MTYYFAGGEDLDFSPIGGPSVSTNGSTFRAGYARCSVQAGNTSSWRLPDSYGLSVTGSFWLTARLIQANLSGTIWAFNGPSDIIALSFTAEGGLYKTVSGVTTLIATATGPVPYNALTKMDVFVNFGSSGSCLIYFDGDLILSYSGDVTGGQSSFVGFDLSRGNWSEIIWADFDTRPLGLVTLVPTANGATDNWDVGGVSNINEITINDATSNQSGTPGQIELYTIGSLPSGNYGIDAVEVVSRAATTAGAPQHIENMVRVGGSNYVSSSYAQAAAFKRNSYIWELNPNTSAAWSPADLGAGFNIGVESLA